MFLKEKESLSDTFQELFITFLVRTRGEDLCWKECCSLYQLSLGPDGQAATYVVGFQAQAWLEQTPTLI